MLLLSIHPRHVESILAGEKIYELRRQCPRVKSGPAVIYATSPRMELVASFEIKNVVRGRLEMIWKLVHDSAGISRREFYSYFDGLSSGVAIQIANVIEFSPISLNELRKAWDGFHPPQGYRYLQPEELGSFPILKRRVA